MDTYTIKLPSVFSTERAQTVLELLSKDYTNSFSSSIKKVVFDFSECSSISPVGLIYIQMWRDSLVEKGKQTFYHKGNKKTDSFLNECGYFRIQKSSMMQILKRNFFMIFINAKILKNAVVLIVKSYQMLFSVKKWGMKPIVPLII